MADLGVPVASGGLVVAMAEVDLVSVVAFVAAFAILAAFEVPVSVAPLAEWGPFACLDWVTDFEASVAGLASAADLSSAEDLASAADLAFVVAGWAPAVADLAFAEECFDPGFAGLASSFAQGAASVARA